MIEQAKPIPAAAGKVAGDRRVPWCASCHHGPTVRTGQLRRWCPTRRTLSLVGFEVRTREGVEVEWWTVEPAP